MQVRTTSLFFLTGRQERGKQERPPDFQTGLFPVRSPLLGESWLVSFPPLNNMLKFSG